MLWPAPTPTSPVEATVRVPGSKSITNRALVLAALADGPGTVAGALRSRDTDLMVAALSAMGAAIDGDRVIPGPLHGNMTVDCGLAGTIMRFLPPVAALADGPVRFDGDEAARVRPMGPILTALRALGAHVDGDGLPFIVNGTGSVGGGEVTLDASASSQLISGLLLSAARFDKGAVIRHDGPPMPSAPHVAMTVAMLRDAGVEVHAGTDRWQVEPGPIRARSTRIEPDLSNAAPFLAAALVTGGRVSIPGWPQRTTQPGDSLRALLVSMGASVTRTPYGLVVSGTGHIAGIDRDLRDVGELTPAISALAALADTPSRLRGIAHLRGHESDRLAALASEINGLGGDVQETGDGLAIRPRPLHKGVFRTYDDHRMATAGAILGLAVPGIEVENIATTSKTLPEFPEMWTRMLGGQ